MAHRISLLRTSFAATGKGFVDPVALTRGTSLLEVTVELAVVLEGHVLLVLELDTGDNNLDSNVTMSHCLHLG